MIIKRLRLILVAVTAAMIALPELAMPVAAMPLAQPGAKPLIEPSSLSTNVEQVAYRRKIKRGGYKYRGARYGNNRYWKGKRYGYNNRYWKNKRYGWNKGRYGKRYGWNNGWNNGWCRYGRCNRYNYGWNNNPWPYFAAGAALGYAGSYYYNDDYYDDGPYYGYGGGNAHVQWCLSRYRSYDPRTDTYLGYDGYRHRCRAPY